MEQWLKAKTAGLPRWAWLGIGSSAIILALYLRSRSGGEGEEEEIEAAPSEGELSYYDGTESAGGLAAAGLIGPAGGSVLPVEAPFIPEGFVDIFAQLAELASLQGAYITEKQQTDSEFAGLGGVPEFEPDHSLPEPETPAPKSGATCTAKDRKEIGRLTGEVKKANAQLAKVNAELKRLNNKFAKTKNQKQREHIRSNITKRQQQRTQLQGKRDSKQQKRDSLRAKCK